MAEQRLKKPKPIRATDSKNNSITELNEHLQSMPLVVKIIKQNVETISHPPVKAAKNTKTDQNAHFGCSIYVAVHTLLNYI